jgi:hypothetical protein
MRHLSSKSDVRRAQNAEREKADVDVERSKKPLAVIGLSMMRQNKKNGRNSRSALNPARGAEG